MRTRAEELTAAMREPFQLSGQTARIGASIGVAVTGDPATDAATLINRADTAMYAVKRRSAGATNGIAGSTAR